MKVWVTDVDAAKRRVIVDGNPARIPAASPKEVEAGAEAAIEPVAETALALTSPTANPASSRNESSDRTS